MSDTTGLVLRDDRLDCAVLRRRLGRLRVVDTFSLTLGDDVSGALRAKLRELRVRAREVQVGIPRQRAVVKVLELPSIADGDLRRVVGFELERHLPFPASDAVFDFVVLEQETGRPTRVLLVATERRVFERLGRLLGDGGFVPRLLDVTVHSLAVMVTRDDRIRPDETRVVVHVEESQVELAVVRGGRPLLSRAFSLPSNGKDRARVLESEFRRSLESLRPDDGRRLADVTIVGAGAPDAEWGGLPVHAEGTPAGWPGGAAAEPRFLPAIAMALRRPRRGALRTNLLPETLRPRPFPWAITVTAGLAILTILMGLAIPALRVVRGERRLAALNQAIERLTPEVREVEQLGQAIERARRELETLRGFDARHVQPLPVLRELSQLLPEDVWLSNLSISPKGVEMAGFAAAASQLIPLLEASSAFERVQFTSPVTKGRDREQFRLRASWEMTPAVPEAATETEPVTPEGSSAPTATEEEQPS